MIDHEKARSEHNMFEEQICRDSYIPLLVDGGYVHGYRVWVRFDDGSEGEVELSDLTQRSGKFSELADMNYFKEVFYNKEMNTIAWSNGLDLAPESLYLRLKGSVNE